MVEKRQFALGDTVYLHLDKKKYYICRIKLKNRAKLLLEFREKSALERKGND